MREDELTRQLATATAAQQAAEAVRQAAETARQAAEADVARLTRKVDDMTKRREFIKHAVTGASVAVGAVGAARKSGSAVRPH